MKCPRIEDLPPSPPEKTDWPGMEQSPFLLELTPEGEPLLVNEKKFEPVLRRLEKSA